VIGFVVGGLFVGLAIALVIARPWLVERGWMFPPGGRGSISKAAMNVATVFEPEVEHVLEAERLAELEFEESGEPVDPE
jgi:hypothetical protein